MVFKSFGADLNFIHDRYIWEIPHGTSGLENMWRYFKMFQTISFKLYHSIKFKKHLDALECLPVCLSDSAV